MSTISAEDYRKMFPKKEVAAFLTAAQYREQFTNDKPKKKSKYNNVKVERHGIKFDSIREADRYEVLKVLEFSGEISELKLQVVFPLVIIDGKVKTRYICDFQYIRNGVLIVEDVKSIVTKKLALYVTKKKLMLEKHGIEITEV